MIPYEPEGHDYCNYPPHEPPVYLSDRGKKIYEVIEAGLVDQGKRRSEYVCFRQDNADTVIEAQINVGEIARAIELVLECEGEGF